MGGGSVEGGLFAQILRKRIALLGTTLRGRSDDYKAALTAAFAEHALPKFVDGSYKPVIERVFASLEEAGAAHELMESNATVGKILLKVA